MGQYNTQNRRILVPRGLLLLGSGTILMGALMAIFGTTRETREGSAIFLSLSPACLARFAENCNERHYNACRAG